MNIKTYRRILGAILLLLGVLGFVSSMVSAPLAEDPHLYVSSNYGRLFGLFPTNALLNVVYIVLGIWGLTAKVDPLSSQDYCKFTGVLMGVFALFGIIPGLNTVFGLLPLFSHRIWLHAVIAGVTAYYGYSWQDRLKLPVTTHSPHAPHASAAAPPTRTAGESGDSRPQQAG